MAIDPKFLAMLLQIAPIMGKTLASQDYVPTSSIVGIQDAVNNGYDGGILDEEFLHSIMNDTPPMEAIGKVNGNLLAGMYPQSNTVPPHPIMPNMDSSIGSLEDELENDIHSTEMWEAGTKFKPSLRDWFKKNKN